MRVLIACEFSGVVRRAFRERGHDAWSCDLEAAEDDDEHHIQRDVRDGVLNRGWDMLVGFPPCTRLCNSGVRWLGTPPRGRSKEGMWREMRDGAALFSTLWNAPVRFVAIENPVMHGYAKKQILNYEEPAQTFQPWQFGHPEIKRTCLWLRNLPPLVPTHVVAGRTPRVHHASPSPDRWKERSRFLAGPAAAMAQQWGGTVHARHA